jgi:hypothetical protein
LQTPFGLPVVPDEHKIAAGDDKMFFKAGKLNEKLNRDLKL